MDHRVSDFAWQTLVSPWESDWSASERYFVAERILLGASGVCRVYSDEIPVAEAVDDGTCAAKLVGACSSNEVVASTLEAMGELT